MTFCTFWRKLKKEMKFDDEWQNWQMTIKGVCWQINQFWRLGLLHRQKSLWKKMFTLHLKHRPWITYTCYEKTKATLKCCNGQFSRFYSPTWMGVWQTTVQTVTMRIGVGWAERNRESTSLNHIDAKIRICYCQKRAFCWYTVLL